MMTIQPKITHALQTIILSGGNEKSNPRDFRSIFEKFYDRLWG